MSELASAFVHLLRPPLVRQIGEGRYTILYWCDKDFYYKAVLNAIFPREWPSLMEAEIARQEIEKLILETIEPYEEKKNV